MFNDWIIVNNEFEGRKILSWNVLGGTKENHESWCPGRSETGTSKIQVRSITT
jgi:hypothetical protein